MLTKQQANEVADSLIAQQHTLNTAARNAKAPRVSRFYRCPGLDRLEPWQQAQFVRDIERALTRNWIYVVCILGWTIACLTAWYLIEPEPPRRGFSILFLIVGLSVGAMIRASFLRHHIWRAARYLDPQPASQ